MPAPYTAYDKRDAVLRDLGFSSYAEYLTSDLWAAIRTAVFWLRGRDCTLCRRSGTVLHHQQYTIKVLIGEDISPIFPLCRTCHRRIEYTPDGRKRPIHEMHKAFRRLKRS